MKSTAVYILFTSVFFLTCSCSLPNEELEYDEMVIVHSGNVSTSRYQIVYDSSNTSATLIISQSQPKKGTLSVSKSYDDETWSSVMSELKDAVNRDSTGQGDECRTYYPYYDNVYADEYTVCAEAFDSAIDKRVREIFDTGEVNANSLGSKSDFRL